MTQATVSRRDFLKSVAATAVLAGVGSGLTAATFREATAEEVEPQEKKVYTSCQACICSCAVIATVRDGRVVRIEGNPESPISRGGVCPKGLSAIQALYNPCRNKYPMRRVGERGTNSFERITWDEAIEEISDKLMQDYNKFGGESLVTSTGGGGNPHFSSPCRFTQAMGSPNIFEPGCAQCFLPRMATFSLMYGGNKSGTTSMADSKYGGCASLYFPEDNPIQSIVMWGTCTSYHAPSGSGRAIAELRKRKQGLNLVVVDPRFTPDAAMAKVWLPIRPGTDVALQMSWIRYIIENDLYDHEFVTKWTNLPYLIDTDTKLMLRAYQVGLGDADAEDAETTFVVWDKNTDSAKAVPWPFDDALDPELFGTYEVDGTEYPTAFTLLRERVDEFTLEKAAEICCLDADQIEKAIRVYTDEGPSGLILGVATDMGTQSAQGAEGACILEFLMGNVERPGALLQRFPDPPNKVDLGTLNSIVSPEMIEKRLGYREHKGLGIWSHSHIPTVFETIKTGEPYVIRNWMERSGNKHAMIGNASQLPEIISKMEMICHLYMYPTAFSVEAADYVLPTQEWLESYFTIAHANKIIIRQPVVHLYETVNEGVIWSQIVRRCAEMGHPNCQKAIDADYLASVGSDLVYWDGQQSMMDMHMGSLPMSWNELAEMGTYEWVSKEDYLHYYTYLDDDGTGKPKGWSTPSKKVEPYSEGTLLLGRTGAPWAKADGKTYVMQPADEDYDPLIYYMEPEETNVGNDEYPVMLTEGRVPFYHHGTLRNIPYLRELYPVPLVSIHPETAEKYGVVDGEWVWVENSRGKVRGKAFVTPGMAKDAIHMERFWNPEYLDTDDPSRAWTEMNVNILTKTDGKFNPEHGTYVLRGLAVKVYPAPEGAPEGAWINPTDFEPWMPEYSESTEVVFK